MGAIQRNDESERCYGTFSRLLPVPVKVKTKQITEGEKTEAKS